MQYPLISRLAKGVTLFRTRAEYFEKTGKIAPDFDWSRPAKNWADTREFADADEEAEYLGIAYDANGKPIEESPGVVKLKRFRLYPEVAATVNLIPSPFPPDAAMTPSMKAMAKRAIPEPLELLEGEKVVISRNLGSEPVIEDSKPTPGASTGCNFTEDDRRLLLAIRSSTQAIVDAITAFTKPSPK